MTNTNVAERLRELGSGEITACIEDAAKVYDMRAACRDAAALIDSLQRDLDAARQNRDHYAAVRKEALAERDAANERAEMCNSARIIATQDSDEAEDRADAAVARATEAIRLRDIAQENAALWSKRRMEALDERNADVAQAVAQQAAMAEELRRYTADHDCDAEDGRGCSRCGRSESEARRERSARATLSSLSPRAKQLLAVMAANEKWTRDDQITISFAREKTPPLKG